MTRWVRWTLVVCVLGGVGGAIALGRLPTMCRDAVAQVGESGVVRLCAPIGVTDVPFVCLLAALAVLVMPDVGELEFGGVKLRRLIQSELEPTRASVSELRSVVDGLVIRVSNSPISISNSGVMDMAGVMESMREVLVTIGLPVPLASRRILSGAERTEFVFALTEAEGMLGRVKSLRELERDAFAAAEDEREVLDAISGLQEVQLDFGSASVSAAAALEALPRLAEPLARLGSLVKGASGMRDALTSGASALADPAVVAASTSQLRDCVAAVRSILLEVAF